MVQYLSSKNIPAHKIYLIGMGKDKYAAPNTTADGRAKNRRVEVKVFTADQIAASLNGDSSTANRSQEPPKQH